MKIQVPVGTSSYGSLVPSEDGLLKKTTLRPCICKSVHFRNVRVYNVKKKCKKRNRGFPRHSMSCHCKQARHFEKKCFCSVAGRGIRGPVARFPPATRETRVQFPADAHTLIFFGFVEQERTLTLTLTLMVWCGASFEHHSRRH